MEVWSPPRAVVRSSRRVWTGVTTGASLWAFYAVAYLTGSLHLLEVHVLDAPAGAAARGATGWTFTHWAHLEAGFFRALDGWLPDGLVAAFTIYYLLGFIVLLVIVPPLVAMTGDRALLARTLLAYPLAWLLALPFNLFVPSRNPYTELGLGDPFLLVHPDLPALYYSLTTVDNTFPSLHVTFTVVLVLAMLRSGHDLLKGAFAVHGALIIASVLVLKVHYVADVLAGVGAAFLALHLADRAVGSLRRPGRVAVALAWASRLGEEHRQRHFCRVEGALPWLSGAAGDLDDPPRAEL